MAVLIMNRMNRTEALQTIRKNLSCKSFLQKTKEGAYICPKCGSGTGEGRTGALNFKPDFNHVKCYAPGCNFLGDVIDLIGVIYGLNFEDAFYVGRRFLGVVIDNEEHPKADYYAIMTGRQASKIYNINGVSVAQCNAKMDHKEADQIEQDHTAYYLKCHNNLLKSVDAWEYLKDRGISLDTAKRFMLGYDPNCDIARTGHRCRRIIIPCTKSFYIGRSIEPDTPKQFRAMQPRGISPKPFNTKTLRSPDTKHIFIVEGVWDALAVEEAGYKAIALNGVGNHEAVVNEIVKANYLGDIVIALDNDGAEATRNTINDIAGRIQTSLDSNSLASFIVNISGQDKDPNDHLLNVGCEEFSDELADIVENLY